jgi:hypothetical protein
LAKELETNRSNVARENETYRANVTKERENERHNRASELLSFNTLSETIRHNRVYETYQDRVLDENIRHNKATEAVQSAAVGESYRHNVQAESQQAYANKIAQYNADISQQRVNSEYRIKDRQVNMDEIQFDNVWGTNTSGKNAWWGQILGPMLYDARSILRNVKIGF